MSDDGGAENCHVPQLDLPIGNVWRDAADERLASEPAGARLHSVVMERIVPRLARIHRKETPGSAARGPTLEEIEEFGQAILGADAAAADELFGRLRARGFAAEALFETLLAPTARRFGELWAEDLCDFVDVTVGVNRLRALLERYSQTDVEAGAPRRRALLISTPSETHVFGLSVVASFLRASGWDAIQSHGRPAEEYADLAAENWFTIVGLTVSEERGLLAAGRAIEAVKRASRNPSISVILGGLALRGRPDLALRIGGDAIADDGPSAALLSHKLYLAQAAARRDPSPPV